MYGGVAVAKHDCAGGAQPHCTCTCRDRQSRHSRHDSKADLHVHYQVLTKQAGSTRLLALLVPSTPTVVRRLHNLQPLLRVELVGAQHGSHRVIQHLGCSARQAAQPCRQASQSRVVGWRCMAVHTWQCIVGQCGWHACTPSQLEQNWPHPHPAAPSGTCAGASPGWQHPAAPPMGCRAEHTRHHSLSVQQLHTHSSNAAQLHLPLQQHGPAPATAPIAHLKACTWMPGAAVFAASSRRR